MFYHLAKINQPSIIYIWNNIKSYRKIKAITKGTAFMMADANDAMCTASLSN